MLFHWWEKEGEGRWWQKKVVTEEVMSKMDNSTLEIFQKSKSTVNYMLLGKPKQSVGE